MMSPGRARLEGIARLRMLRAAIGYRLDGQVPALPDPFGTTLRSASNESGLRIWSVGRNGRDEAGATMGRAGQDDLLFEVPR